MLASTHKVKKKSVSQEGRSSLQITEYQILKRMTELPDFRTSTIQSLNGL